MALIHAAGLAKQYDATIKRAGGHTDSPVKVSPVSPNQ